MTLDTPSAATLAERDAARYINFTRAFLKAARRTGRGPAFLRIGRSIRYRVVDLEAWLDAHRVESREPSSLAPVRPSRPRPPAVPKTRTKSGRAR